MCLYSTQKVGLGSFLKRKNYCCSVVGSYFSCSSLLFQVQPYRSAKFAKKFGQVPYAKFAKYFEMVHPRNLIPAKFNPLKVVKAHVETRKICDKNIIFDKPTT